MKKWTLIATLIGIWLIPSASLLAQVEDSVRTQVREQLEKAFEELEDEEGLVGEELIQFLEDLAANPINLNSANMDDLLQIPGVNLKIADAILKYRKTKPFAHKLDLHNVDGIGDATYQRMSPYVTIGGLETKITDIYTRPGFWFDGYKVEYISRYQQELQEQEGYKRDPEDGGYLGSPMKYYHRLKLNSRHLSINFTQEKDPGETLKNPADFDFNSGHIALERVGKLKRLVVGDYSLSFGQGLVLWTGAAFGKGRDVIRTAGKNERGLRPYSSAQETDAYRGVAATYGDTFEVTGFYSKRKRTASIISGDTTRFPSSSGFHRTQNELDRRNNIDQLTAGGRLRYITDYGIFGATGYYNEFSSFIQKPTALSNMYDFEGRGHSVLGVDYRGLIGPVLVYGELGRSENGGMGGVLGVESGLGVNTDLTFHYRNYARDFQSIRGVGFGETSNRPRNEEGFYVGLQHKLSSKYSFSTYVDQFTFREPRRGMTQGSDGYDVLGLFEANFNRDLEAYILLRNKVVGSEYRITDDRGLEDVRLGKDQRSSVRLETNYKVSQAVQLRSRVELTRSRKAGADWESGFLIYQDIRFYPMPKLQIDARFTLFDTESFDTRVYQFENDLLYVMSNTMLSGQGQRSYFVVKYEALERLDIWLKYGVTYYENVHTVSSGLNEIQGQMKNQIGVQVRVKI